MRRIVLALPALALLSACGLLTATLEVPTVTITIPEQQFPGAPGGGTQTVTTDVTFDLNEQIPELLEEDVTFTLKLKGLDLTAITGDLGFVDALTVEAVPPAGSGLPVLTLVEYAKPPPPADQNPTSITVATSADDSLTPYLEAGLLTFHCSVTGTLPLVDWSATATAAFSLDATIDYGNKL